MKNFIHYIEYLLLRFFLALIRCFPLRFLYFLSNIAYFILFEVIRYRRKITQHNLRICFPTKDEYWIEATAHKFYHHLSDILLESLKGFSLSREELLKRFKLSNPDIFCEIEKKYSKIIIASAHYGNWEWGALLIPSLLKYQTYGIYKPLSNKYIDRYLKTHRALWGMHLVSVTQTGFMFRNSNERQAFFFLSDQYPGNRKKALQFEFMGMPTLWLGGLEKYARHFQLPVYYFGIRRVSRGKYEVFAEPIAENPQQLDKGEIINKYVKILEKEVEQCPSNWLWSHRRWKNLVERTNLFQSTGGHS